MDPRKNKPNLTAISMNSEPEEVKPASPDKGIKAVLFGVFSKTPKTPKPNPVPLPHSELSSDKSSIETSEEPTEQEQTSRDSTSVEDVVGEFDVIQIVAPVLPAKKEEILEQIEANDNDKTKFAEQFISNPEKWIKTYKFNLEELNRLFSLAIETGCVETLRLIVTTYRYKPQDKFPTCLHFAVQKGQLDCVRYLLTLIKPNILDDKKELPIHYAIINQYKEIAALLCEKDKTGSYRKEFHWILTKSADPSFHFVMSFIYSSLKWEDFKLFIKELSQSSYLKDKILSFIRYEAAFRGRLDIFKFLKQEEIVGLEKNDIVIATKFDHFELLKWLLAESKNTFMEWYPDAMEEAVNRDYLHLIEYLLKEYCNNKGSLKHVYQNLYRAIEHGHLDIIKSFFAHLKQSDEKFITVRHDDENFVLTAIQSGKLNILKYLVEEENCTLNRKFRCLANSPGPMLIAAENGHTEIMEWLHTKGIALDEQDNKGGHAAIYAAEKGHLNVLIFLKEKGFCDFSTPNQNKKTALLVAVGQDYSKHTSREPSIPTIEFLLAEDGAASAFENEAKFNPLHRSIYLEMPEVIACLLPYTKNEIPIDQKAISYFRRGFRDDLGEETLAYILPYLKGSYEDCVSFLHVFKDNLKGKAKERTEDFCRALIEKRFKEEKNYNELWKFFHEINQQAALDFKFLLFIKNDQPETAKYMSQDILEDEKQKQDHDWAKFHLAYQLVPGLFSLVEENSPLNKEPFLKNPCGDSDFEHYLQARYILRDCKFIYANGLREHIFQNLMLAEGWEQAYKDYSFYKTNDIDQEFQEYVLQDKVEKIGKEKGKEKVGLTNVGAILFPQATDIEQFSFTENGQQFLHRFSFTLHLSGKALIISFPDAKEGEQCMKPESKAAKLGKLHFYLSKALGEKLAKHIKIKSTLENIILKANTKEMAEALANQLWDKGFKKVDDNRIRPLHS